MPAPDDVDDVLSVIESNLPCIERDASKVSDRLAIYQFTTCELGQRDVRQDLSYQKAFRTFYRMQRMPKHCQVVVFDILEREKHNITISFLAVLTEVFDRLDRVEPSFSSKVVATIRPDAVVYDSIVRNLLQLGHPTPWMPPSTRITQAVSIYGQIDDFAKAAVQRKKFNALVAHFDRTFPMCASLHAVKKLDIMMWQSRARS